MKIIIITVFYRDGTLFPENIKNHSVIFNEKFSFFFFCEYIRDRNDGWVGLAYRRTDIFGFSLEIYLYLSHYLRYFFDGFKFLKLFLVDKINYN